MFETNPEDGLLQAKRTLAQKRCSSQVIDPEKVITNDKYHFSLPNIAIAILAKLNGTPCDWTPSSKNELIVGVGAFKHSEVDVQYIGSAFSFSNTGNSTALNAFRRPNKRVGRFNSESS